MWATLYQFKRMLTQISHQLCLRSTLTHYLNRHHSWDLLLLSSREYLVPITLNIFLQTLNLHAFLNEFLYYSRAHTHGQMGLYHS